MIIETGKPYPDERYRTQEGAIIVTNSALFDLLIIVPDISAKELKAFRAGALRYGMFVADNVPFFLIDFPEAGMTLDAPFNPLKIDSKLQAAWIADKNANAVTITSIEQRGYCVKSQRLVGLEPAFVNSFKAAAADTALRHTTARGVDLTIQAVTQRLSTEQMIKAAKMYSL